ncbi:MAG: PAS domain-containing protein, partial [Piscinibacter sp.]|nr:PAS domain-containing protein [Piscinibacter sp.]
MPAMPDFSTLFEQLPIGAYRSSLEGRQRRANAALVRLNGYESEAEMLAAVGDIGREWYVDPGQRAEFARRLERDGLVIDFDSEVYRHKTRERIWIRETAHAVRDSQGRVLCYEGTVQDITAERATRLA